MCVCVCVCVFNVSECHGALAKDGRVTPGTTHSPNVEWSTYCLQGTLLGAESKSEARGFSILMELAFELGKRVVNKLTNKHRDS